MSGSQEASLKLVGAGQDALSVNTWSHTAECWCFFFFRVTGFRHTRKRAHTHAHTGEHTHTPAASQGHFGMWYLTSSLKVLDQEVAGLRTRKPESPQLACGA